MAFLAKMKPNLHNRTVAYRQQGGAWQYKASKETSTVLHKQASSDNIRACHTALRIALLSDSAVSSA